MIMVVCHSKSSLNTNLKNSLTSDFFTIETLHMTSQINEFSADMHFKVFTISKMIDILSTITYRYQIKSKAC